MSYLNHAGTSWPKPEPVREAVARALAAPPVEWPAAFEAAHGRVAAALGIADASRLLLTPGCTSALALAVADHAWESGDRVLVSSLEHHALDRPVALLRDRGVVVHTIPRADDGPLDLDALEAELAAGRTRLVAMTAACNVTGELLPVTQIVALAREHGALSLIDGAQVCGWSPVHLGQLGVDMFAFAGHKALQGPWGIGGLYVARDVAMSSPAAACELPLDGAAAACSTMPGYCDAGSVDRAALAGLASAVDWLEAPERRDRLGRARSLVERLTRALEERRGVRLHGARDPERRLPTIAFTLEGSRTAEVAAAFARRGISVAGGLQCAPRAHAALRTAPDGAIRLSAGPSTREEDIEEALAAIAALPSPGAA